MKWTPDRYERLRRLLRGVHVEEDVDEEFEHHLQLRMEALQASGMSADQARKVALERFGDWTRFQQETIAIEQSVLRETKRMELLDSFRRELKQAARGLLRSPGFAVVAIVTLALGIGASTTVHTLLDAVVLNPLPYPEPDRLAYIQHAVPGIQADAKFGMAPATYFHYKERSRGLANLAIYSQSNGNLRAEREAMQARVVHATGTLLSMLGARPALGRLFLPEDDTPRSKDGPYVSTGVLSYAFWQRAFGGDPGVLKQKLTLEGYTLEIVGVAAEGFDIPNGNTDVFVTRRFDPSGPFYNEHYLTGIGRMRPGLTLEGLQNELRQLAGELTERFPTVYGRDFMESSQFTPVAADVKTMVVGKTARTLWILFGSVAVVLLIAAVNVANLFLVRAESRRNEVAVRSALGADRAHLFVQSLAEALLVAVLAGALGLWLAFAGLRLLTSASASGLPRLNEVQLGLGAVLFAIAVSLIAALVFSVFPQLRKRSDYGPLRESGRGLTATRAQLRIRSGLVATQVALAIVLLSAAGLMLRSFQQMRAVDLGFDARNVLAVDVFLPIQQYSNYDVSTRYWRMLSERVGALPGVTQVGTTRNLPLQGLGCAVLRARPAATDKITGCVPNEVITPGYFEALGIRVRGRVPTWQDIDAQTGAVVITEALAQRLWPGEEALGKGVKVPNGDDSTFYQVVGVAADIRAKGVEEPAPPIVFYPVRPIPGAGLWQARNSMKVVLRTSTDRPEQHAAAIRRIAMELEPAAAIGEIQTMEQVVSKSMAGTSFIMILLAIAGVMALIISIVGLYGVIAYTVNRRRSELGIRLALGARPSEVGTMVVKQSVLLAAIGVVIGLFGALFSMRLLNSMLYNVRPTDPLTLTAVSVLLLTVAALASFVPAARASRVSPVETLRH
jgi:putative ABC transport system permease protein